MIAKTIATTKIRWRKAFITDAAEMWRRQYDTKSISVVLRVSESRVWNSLSTIRAHARQIGEPVMKSIVLALLIALATATGAHAQSCFVGASVGTTANHTSLDDGVSRLDIGGSGLQVGPEIGCSIKLGAVQIGGLARYDFQNTDAKVEDVTIKASGRWMAAATLGFDLNPGTTAYGLLGIAGTELKIPDVKDPSHLGTVVGAGLAIDIGQGPLSLFAEYNYIRFSDERVEGTKVVPEDHVLRVGARFSVGK